MLVPMALRLDLTPPLMMGLARLGLWQLSTDDMYTDYPKVPKATLRKRKRLLKRKFNAILREQIFVAERKTSLLVCA